MANTFVLTSSASTVIGAGGNTGMDVLVFEVAAASSLICDVRTNMTGSGTTPANNAYYNMRTTPLAIVATGTAITANGIYAVACPAMTVTIATSSGSATLTQVSVLGRV